MAEPLIIDGRCVGPGERPFIVAELSANHRGSLDEALSLIDLAAETGADAVKIQTYTADTITIDHDGPGFAIHEGPWAGRTLHNLYAEAYTPWEWHKALFDRARQRGMTAFSSPFDSTAVSLLEGLGVPAYKIASFEVVDLPLIRLVAGTGKPLVISTGLADAGEIAEAVRAARAAGAKQIALLHCVSGYPSEPSEANLRTMLDLAASFDVVVGLSDHSLGHAVATAAVSLGAALVEKHLTRRRADSGPDSGFSMEPPEFKVMVDVCRTASDALGRVSYELAPSERRNFAFRRSLYAVSDIAKGEAFTPANVRSIRPGYGLPPKTIDRVIGRRAQTAIKRGTPLDWSLIES